MNKGRLELVPGLRTHVPPRPGEGHWWGWGAGWVWDHRGRGEGSGDLVVPCLSLEGSQLSHPAEGFHWCHKEKQNRWCYNWRFSKRRQKWGFSCTKSLVLYCRIKLSKTLCQSNKAEAKGSWKVRVSSWVAVWYLRSNATSSISK